MTDYVHLFVFGIYPYICLSVFLLGSLVRFEREQYTWRSGSSQLLRARQLYHDREEITVFATVR